MHAQQHTWSNFWKSERHAFDEVMQLATQYFARQFCEIFKVDHNTRILDYGCGPGFLADALMAVGVDFYGADINEYFVESCRKRHPSGHFFTVHAEGDNNAKILQSCLGAPMDFIVLLSISQYLSSADDLEKIIAALKPYLKTGSVIVVADVVDSETRSYRDALSLLYHAARNGKTGAFIRFMRYVLRAEYARVVKTTHLQQIPEGSIAEICRHLGMTYRRIDGLTFHPTRKNYALELNS